MDESIINVKNVGDIKKYISLLPDDMSIRITGLYGSEVFDADLMIVETIGECNSCGVKKTIKQLLISTDICTG